jgi:outer membrane receptor protein involved in Fe transport
MPRAPAIFSAILFGLAALPATTHAGDADPAAPATTTVIVTGRKPPVVRKLDKTVHDVVGMARAANGTAQDVLQALPEVTATADGRISVKGNPQVTVLVDGRPSAQLSGSSEERAVALQTMSGADIASVEVITNPSAALAAGGGAIVNIVLKRNRKPGSHAQMQGSIADQGLWNAGASGDVTRNGISVHANAALRHDGTLKVRRSEVDWAGAQSGHTLQTSTVFVRRVVESAALGIDAALDGGGTLSLSARHNARRSRPLFDVLNEDRNAAGETISHRISDGPNAQSDDSASASYSRQADGAALRAMVQHSATRGLVDKSYRDIFIEPVRDTDTSHGTTRTARHLDQATLDWSRAATHGQWGAGLDLRRQADGIDNRQAQVDPATGAETLDPATTNGYTVTTTSAAAWVTDQVRLGKWEALLGGRAGRTALHVATERPAYWQAFDPSLHLKYAFDADAEATLAFRRSLQMPDPRDLNPFTTYVDAQNLSRGNPGLGPQRLTSWEIGTHASGSRLDGGMSVFYRVTRNTVFDSHSFDGTVLVTSKQNGGQARSAGVAGAIDWTPFTSVRLGIDVGAYRVVLDTPDPAGPVHQDGVAGYLNARAAYSSAHDDVALDAHAQSAGLVPLGRTGPTSSVNITWKHAVGKALSLTVSANDIFDGSKRTWRTDTRTFRQAGSDHFVARRLWVGVVRKFE